MKKYKSFSSSVLLAMLILLTVNAYAVKHVVSVSNFLFSPSTVNANVGDTMRWVWVSGFHTTTSGIIPAGASAWNAPIQGAGQFFEYKITIAGNYNYRCAIHASMTGSFSAASATPTLSVTPSNQNVSAASGTTSFNVTSNSTWTANSNAVWCTVTNGGTGNGSITANYSANPNVTQRVATITVTVATLPEQTVTVTQAGSPALLASVSATPASIIAGQTSQLDATVSGGTGIYTYSWTSNPVGFTSALKNPIVTPPTTTIYTCEVTSGSQTSSPTVTVSVNPQFITVTSPDGGENWTQGSSHNITWIDNIADAVTIDLYKSGSFLQQIIASTPSTGTYSWVINANQQPGPDYTVRITNTINSAVTDFSNADFAISAVPASALILQNDTVFNGQTRCYNATQTISVAVDGNPFIVESGGIVTMIAGLNILYLPGTVINIGGYMHGSITANGEYCVTPSAPLLSGLGSGQEITASLQTLFKVYPNPATGIFMLELSGDLTSSAVDVTVFGTLGDPVLKEKIIGEAMHEFSLSGKPAGVYYLRLISGNRTETVKIVKQ